MFKWVTKMYQILGDCPTIQMLDWMIANQSIDHSLQEIANGAGIATHVAKKNIKRLEDYGVVKVSRMIRRDKMYMLNLQNPCTKAIITFDGKIADCCKKAEYPVDEENRFL